MQEPNKEANQHQSMEFHCEMTVKLSMLPAPQQFEKHLNNSLVV